MLKLVSHDNYWNINSPVTQKQNQVEIGNNRSLSNYDISVFCNQIS